MDAMKIVGVMAGMMFMVGAANAQTLTLDDQLLHQYNQEMGRQDRFVTFEEYKRGAQGNRPAGNNGQNDALQAPEDKKLKKSEGKRDE